MSGIAIPRSIDSFHVVGELGAGRGKELDPVVVERVVRRADHDPRRQPQRARQVRDARCRQRAAQIDVDARGRQAGFQRRLQHVAGNARVLADENAGTIAAPRAVDRHQRAAQRPSRASS